MEPTLGEIRIFGGNYAPLNWAMCQGQLLAISNYEALFSLIGNEYGGDGRTNFALPDMRGRVAVGQGQLPGGQNYALGGRGGVERVQLTLDQIPHHQHHFMVNKGTATQQAVTDHMLAAPNSPAGEVVFYLPEDPGEEKILPLKDDALHETGGDVPHENRMPFLSVNYIICLKGLYPSWT